MSRLNEFCLNITDGEHASVIDDPQGSYYLLSNKNIIDGQILITDSDRKISKGTFEKIDKRTKLENGDVLISTVGTLGKTAVVKGYINYAFQRSVGIIKPDKEKLNSHFLKYRLDSKQYQELFDKISKGAVQKCIFISDLMNLEVDIPSLNHQEQIVKVLKCLDDKIENNNAITNKLESLAKTIYDYWFLQFEFPNEEGKPYKSSGGEMVWNEELKREIPEGWECKTIKDISDRVKVGFVGKVDEFYCEKEEGVPIIRPAEMGSDGIKYDELRYVTRDFYEINKKSQIHKGDVLISRCGKDGIPNIYELDEEAQVLNAVIIEPNKAVAGSLFITETLKSPYVQKQIMFGTSGSVQGVVNTAMIASIILPLNNEICKMYVDRMSGVYSMISSLRKENQELSSLRDFLLPLLMNGQVGFKEEQ